MNFMKTLFSLAIVACVALALPACSNNELQENSTSEPMGARDDLLMTDSKLLQLRTYVDNAGFPLWDRNRATCIILCESAGRSDARTGVHVGLFQINETYPGTEGGRGVKHPTQPAWNASGRQCGANLKDPQVNADCAFVRLSRAGWKDWDCGGAVPYLKTQVEACRMRLDERLGR
jgi:hypothetical protein